MRKKRFVKLLNQKVNRIKKQQMKKKRLDYFFSIEYRVE